jgi:hypothetical protein
VRVTRYLRFLQTATRTYSKLRTMWDPDFMAPNLLKDWQTAGIQLGDPESARVKVRRALSPSRVNGALAELWRYSRDKESRSAWRPWLERAIEDGMPVSWVHPKAIEERLADFERAIQDMRPDQSVWSRFREFLRLVEDGNFAAENAVRLAAYRGSIEEGISRARAASIAKNLTVNWERTGEVGPALA